jgi:Uma2 family endonuclease
MIESNHGRRAELLLMTVEQYAHLPKRQDVIQELHWGQLIVLERPKMKHTRLQNRLVKLLSRFLEGKGEVNAEMPFRALPEYDVRSADVAFVSKERWEGSQNEDWLRGSPELVIEVLSPSNTKAEMREKAALYLSTGCEEFWVVDPERRTVSITRRGGENVVYESDAVLGSAIVGEVAVPDIFSAI